MSKFFLICFQTLEQFTSSNFFTMENNVSTQFPENPLTRHRSSQASAVSIDEIIGEIHHYAYKLCYAMEEAWDFGLESIDHHQLARVNTLGFQLLALSEPQHITPSQMPGKCILYLQLFLKLFMHEKICATCLISLNMLFYLFSCNICRI